MARTISFAEVVPDRDTTVRVTDDNLLVAVDLAMAMTGKNCNHANECLRDLKQSLWDNEKFVIRDRTRLLTFQHAVELVMILPGKVAKETRTKFADVIKRYMAGDECLVSEIRANAQSESLLTQLARTSTSPTQVVDTQALERKRRFEDMEYKKLATETGLNIVKGIQTVQADTSMDERTRLIMKDYFLNLATQGSGLAVENGEQRESPISLSTVAMDMGHRLTDSQAKKIGIKLKRSYVQKHGEAPPKHEQLVNGRVTRVNSYTTRDLSMVQEVIKAFMDAEQASDEDSDAVPY